jgi:hypothetical protein
MCEVCKAHGENYLFKNGAKKMLINNKLYKVFKNNVAPVKLCYVHTIELFHLGERRFLREHLVYARVLVTKNRVASAQSEDAFGI